MWTKDIIQLWNVWVCLYSICWHACMLVRVFFSGSVHVFLCVSVCQKCFAGWWKWSAGTFQHGPYQRRTHSQEVQWVQWNLCLLRLPSSAHVNPLYLNAAFSSCSLCVSIKVCTAVIKFKPWNWTRRSDLQDQPLYYWFNNDSCNTWVLGW